MARSQEIPDWIKEINPQYIIFSVIPYSEDKIFLQSKEALEDFKTDIISRLNYLLDEPNLLPQVFVYNFEGIESIVVNNTISGMRYIFSRFRNQRKENCTQTYPIFDGLSTKSTESLSPWEGMGRSLRGIISSKPVVIARKQERIKYNLLGNEEKVSKFLDLWGALSEKQAWVNGEEFSKEHLNPTATITLHDMNDLYDNGLALHSNYRGTSYFRSII